MSEVASSDLSRPADPTARTHRSDADGLGAALIELGIRSGLTRVGIASADVFVATRHDLLERRQQGLHAEMQFTYRNPERSTDPTRIVPGAQALIVGAWSYRSDHVDERITSDLTSRPAGRVARYAQRDHYGELRKRLEPIADALGELGWRASVVCDDNALVDRAAAHRAGIGWYGKNSLLLLPELGSWFVLGSVVTDAPLCPTAPSPPVDHASGCGSCSRCLTACPTGALIEPGVLDARRCLAWLVQAPGSFPEEYREALGDRIYGCDECQQVCPINKIADRKNPPSPDREAEGGAGDGLVDLIDLLWASDDRLLATHGRWYIANRDPRYLRRNALVALGNVGRGDDRATEEILVHWLATDDPMLAEHARWAANKLGRQDLVGGVQ